jgi:hypothetical protein
VGGIVRGGIQCGRDEEESAERSSGVLGLVEMERSLESSQIAEGILDDRADGGTTEVERRFEVDLPKSVTEDRQIDPIGVSLGDFTNLLELEELQKYPCGDIIEYHRHRGHVSI